MEAVLANSAEKGLHVAKTQKIDAILLDIMMPDMQGDEVAALLEKDPATANIPIIFLTSLAAVGDPQEHLESEHWVLSKALPPQELMSKLRELI
jgi:CheY-like chemotaxis protein